MLISSHFPVISKSFPSHFQVISKSFPGHMAKKEEKRWTPAWIIGAPGGAFAYRALDSKKSLGPSADDGDMNHRSADWMLIFAPAAILASASSTSCSGKGEEVTLPRRAHPVKVSNEAEVWALCAVWAGSERRRCCQRHLPAPPASSGRFRLPWPKTASIALLSDILLFELC